jgi:hypothetical protein
MSPRAMMGEGLPRGENARRSPRRVGALPSRDSSRKQVWKMARGLRELIALSLLAGLESEQMDF